MNATLRMSLSLIKVALCDLASDFEAWERPYNVASGKFVAGPHFRILHSCFLRRWPTLPTLTSTVVRGLSFVTVCFLNKDRPLWQR